MVCKNRMFSTESQSIHNSEGAYHQVVLFQQVRAVISDFAILIAIMVMVGVDLAFGINTPKLDIPLKFQPTASEKRGWVVPPLGTNPVWTIPAAAIPALLATILVFMDQQITALIVNRREHKLKVNTSY